MIPGVFHGDQVSCHGNPIGSAETPTPSRSQALPESPAADALEHEYHRITSEPSFIRVPYTTVFKELTFIGTGLRFGIKRFVPSFGHRASSGDQRSRTRKLRTRAVGAGACGFLATCHPSSNRTLNGIGGAPVYRDDLTVCSYANEIRKVSGHAGCLVEPPSATDEGDSCNGASGGSPVHGATVEGGRHYRSHWD